VPAGAAGASKVRYGRAVGTAAARK
jgi:hypothetical protein